MYRQMGIQQATRVMEREVRQTRRNFQGSLRADRQQRVQEAGATIEALMESGQRQEAWDRILRYYRQVKGKKVTLSR